MGLRLKSMFQFFYTKGHWSRAHDNHASKMDGTVKDDPNEMVGFSHSSTNPDAQWVRKAKNRDVSAGPLACPFARSLAPLTYSLPSSWERVILMTHN